MRRRTLVDGVGTSCKRKEEIEREACYTPCQTIEELESVIREKEEDFAKQTEDVKALEEEKVEAEKELAEKMKIKDLKEEELNKALAHFSQCKISQ